MHLPFKKLQKGTSCDIILGDSYNQNLLSIKIISMITKPAFDKDSTDEANVCKS